MTLQLQLCDENNSAETLLQKQLPKLVSNMKARLETALKKGGEKAPNLADIFVEGILSSGDVCLANSSKGPVLVVAGVNCNVAYPISGKDVEHAIQAVLFRLKQTANDRALEPIRSAMIATAIHGEGARSIKVHEYSAPGQDGSVFLDMRRGDGSALKISSSGVDSSPKNEGVTFLYDKALGPRPTPLLGEKSPFRLRRYMSNVEGLDFWLLVGYVTFAWCHPAATGLTMPMLQLSGSAGSGKTTLTRLLMTLMAPREDAISDPTGKYQDMVVLAQTDRVIAIDNTEVADKKTSNLLCGMATASSVKVRELYTTNRMVTMGLHNFVITNGILGMAGRHDLLSRAVPIKVVKPTTQFPSDTAMMEEFNRDLPSTFSKLLEISARCLKLEESGKTVATVTNHRARDFANWLACLEKILLMLGRIDSGNALQVRLNTLMEMSMDDVAEQNHLVMAVIEFMEKQPGWHGTPSELYELLTEIPDYAVTKSRLWPNSASAMTSRLKQDESLLSKKKISIEFGRGKERWVKLINADQEPNNALDYTTTAPESDGNDDIRALLH